LEVYLTAEHAAEVISIASGLGLEAQLVGRVEASNKTELTIRSEFGTFEY